MKDVLAGLFFSMLLRGGCILPLVFSFAVHDIRPNEDAHWRHSIPLTVALVGVLLLWMYRMELADRAYDQAKNDAQKLNVGDRLRWEYDAGTIIEKGSYHVTVKWDEGAQYPSRLDRVWPSSKSRWWFFTKWI
jgi:hypothetical protein